MKNRKETLKSLFAYSPASPKEKLKIFVQFFIMLSASVVMGIIFGNFFVSGIFVARNYLLAVEYFEGFALDAKTIGDFLMFVLKEAKYELVSVLIIAVSAFTLINYLISDTVIAVRGFTDAFFCGFLFRCLSNEALTANIHMVHFIAYLLSKIILLYLLFSFSCRASLYSLKLRRINSDGRVNISKKNTLWLILYTLSALGAVILVKGIYVLTIFLTK